MKVILDKKFNNWILGGIIRESSEYANSEIHIQMVSLGKRHAPITYLFRRYVKGIKILRGDLIVNQNTLLYMIENRFIQIKDLCLLKCFYTHAAEKSLKQGTLVKILSKLDKVLVQNENDRSLLISYGLPREKILVVYGGIDRKKFYPSENLPTKKFVLVTGDAKLRKNPAKIVDLVSTCNQIEFVVCGRYWEEFLKSKELLLPNLQVFDYESRLNEELMRQASVFLTVSSQEGGPYPVLEALASGTPVVSTPVGWSSELINDSNGRLIAFDTEIKDIHDSILACIDLKSAVFSKDLLNGRFGMKEFAQLLYRN